MYRTERLNWLDAQIGEEKQDGAVNKTHQARRWVAKRTFSWLPRRRGLLVR